MHIATTTKSSSFDAIDDANIVHKYKVAMGVCVALVVVMLFTLLSMVVCLVINRQRKISQRELSVSMLQYRTHIR